MPAEFALNLDFNSKSGERDAFAADFQAMLDRACEKDQGERRTYLGASQLGDECQRRVVYEVTGAPAAPFDGRTLRIFQRGHLYEDIVGRHLGRAGFTIRTFDPRTNKQLGFSQLDGAFKGHIDGVIIHAPSTSGIKELPALWENKALGSKGFTKVKKEGVAKAYPKYADQIVTYQTYMELHAPALFTAICPDTEEIYAELIPYDARRAQEVSDRAASLIAMIRAGETPPRASNDPESFVCRFCRFTAHCWGQQ